MARWGLPEGVTSGAQTEQEGVGGKDGIQGLGDPQMAPRRLRCPGKGRKTSGGGSSFLGSEFYLGKAKCRDWQDPPGG